MANLDGEIWINIPDYDGLYQVSNLGRVKSFSKVRGENEKILKQYLNKHGYYFVRLHKDGKTKNKTTHRLVWESFNGKTNMYVLHNVEGNKLDNRLCNLHIGDCRQNTTDYFLSKPKSSKYIGVSFNKKSNKWMSRIQIKGKNIDLGTFDTEEKAHIAYQNKLKTLNNKPLFQ